MDDDGEILTPAEAAAFFRVRQSTLARWADTGKIPRDCWFRTLGVTGRGDHRYHKQKLWAFMKSCADG